MLCSYRNFKRRAGSALRLMAAFLCLFSAGLTPASATKIQSPKENTLFVTASVPSGFNNTLCITLNEHSTGKSFTLKFDCTSNLSVNVQLENGSYEIVNAYTLLQSARYDVSYDNTEFTIGDGSSPMVSMIVQGHTQPSATPLESPIPATTDTPSDEPVEDAEQEPSEESVAIEEGAVEDSNALDESEPSEEFETETAPSDSQEEEGDNSNSTKGKNILNTAFQIILGLFAVVLLFCVIAVIAFFWRNRN